jgi:hypothetical protein
MSREHLERCIPSLTMSPWLSSAFGDMIQLALLPKQFKFGALLGSSFGLLIATLPMSLLPLSYRLWLSGVPIYYLELAGLATNWVAWCGFHVSFWAAMGAAIGSLIATASRSRVPGHHG